MCFVSLVALSTTWTRLIPIENALRAELLARGQREFLADGDVARIPVAPLGIGGSWIALRRAVMDCTAPPRFTRVHEALVCAPVCTELDRTYPIKRRTSMHHFFIPIELRRAGCLYRRLAVKVSQSETNPECNSLELRIAPSEKER